MREPLLITLFLYLISSKANILVEYGAAGVFLVNKKQTELIAGGTYQL